MGRAGGRVIGRVAKWAALTAGCLALAACAAGNKVTSSQYSRKMVEDGEPIPKGGGSYKVGRPYEANGRTFVPTEDPHYRAEGIASWYGPDFHGRETANGEVYDMHAITAAHPTMPIPSYARVTNLHNGRSIIVRVNDRGPFVGNRVIDLSIAAAKALDTYSRGLARVRVEYVGRAPLKGNDDEILLATLRTGSPAPAPSTVRLASNKPAGESGPAAERGREKSSANAREVAATPLPPGRPLILSAASSRPAMRSAAADASAGRSALSAPEQTFTSAAGGSAMGFASGGGYESIGLVSGRGLY